MKSGRRSKKMRKNKKAFTLIELLIVIAIIGILASVILVSLNEARTKAKISALQSAGKQIADTFHACEVAGGKITTPDSVTTPTNDICTIPSGTVWPTFVPQNMEYNTTTMQTNGNNNAILIRDSGSAHRMWCGTLPEENNYYCSVAVDPAWCTFTQRYTCIIRSDSLYGDTTWRLLF
jgi:prepilin-type N-terminal cleavage/methylation domain-containing protein